ncbi:MAG TPA: 4Fe-4S binding protein [Pirellulaceae bacterium]|nr:4Fe-4S binding protein [Pirellulaceae bacterium]HMP70156.1 4Fe-4S binding protein [Pirellulaceae bacterium]
MPKKTAGQEGIELPILQPNKNIDNDTCLPKRGRGRVRALVLIGVHLLILAHITHFWMAGKSLSPVEPSEAMATLELGQVNAGAIFFGLAIVSTAIFGRFFCGWGCHIVALQDLSGHLLRRIGLRPKPLRSRLLILVPFVLAFYMFIWPTVQRLWLGNPHPGLSNHLITIDFWQTFPGPVVSILTFVVCGSLIVYLLGNKGFCTYACPYGAFFSVADRLALGRIRVTDACHQCGQCTAHCTSNVQVHAEVRDFGMVVNPGCMKCMDCVSVCPNEALYFGLTTRSGANNTTHTLPILSKPTRSKRVYDYSLAEEFTGLLVTGVTVYAIRGLYDFTPLLLSVAVGVITAYLILQFFRLFRKRDLRTQNIQLKRGGRITQVGWWAAIFVVVWAAFLVHSCFVQYHRYQGREYLTRITATWTDLFSGVAQSKLTTEDHANIDKGLRSYELTDRFGIVHVVEVKLGLALGYLAKGDLEAAENHFRQAYACNPPQVRELLREFLAYQNRPEDAAAIH